MKPNIEPRLIAACKSSYIPELAMLAVPKRLRSGLSAKRCPRSSSCLMNAAEAPLMSDCLLPPRRRLPRKQDKAGATTFKRHRSARVPALRIDDYAVVLIDIGMLAFGATLSTHSRRGLSWVCSICSAIRLFVEQANTVACADYCCAGRVAHWWPFDSVAAT